MQERNNYLLRQNYICSYWLINIHLSGWCITLWGKGILIPSLSKAARPTIPAPASIDPVSIPISWRIIRTDITRIVILSAPLKMRIRVSSRFYSDSIDIRLSRTTAILTALMIILLVIMFRRNAPTIIITILIPWASSHGRINSIHLVNVSFILLQIRIDNTEQLNPSDIWLAFVY